MSATDSGPLPQYGVRKCRGHWHVTSGGEDIAVVGDPFATCEEANAIAERMERGEKIAGAPWLGMPHLVDLPPIGNNSTGIPMHCFNGQHVFTFGARVCNCGLKPAAAPSLPAAAGEPDEKRLAMNARAKTFDRRAMREDFMWRWTLYNRGAPASAIADEYVADWAANLTREGWSDATLGVDAYQRHAAGYSLPAVAGEPGVVEPDPYFWLRGLALARVAEGSMLYFTTTAQQELRAAFAELATLRSTLDAREQRIGELTNDAEVERERIRGVVMRRHTRLAEAVGDNPGYSVDGTIDHAIELLASREARIGELEKELEAAKR